MFAKQRFVLIILFFLGSIFSAPLLAQSEIQPDELPAIFNGHNLAQALSVIKERDISPYRFGIELTQRGYPKLALSWFQGMIEKEQDNKYLFGLAWTSYTMGDLKAVKKDLTFLFDQDLTPIVRARSLRLSAQIASAEGKYAKAAEQYQQAMATFREQDYLVEEYNCSLMLAHNALDRNDLPLAIHHLQETKRLVETVKSKGLKPSGTGHITLLEAVVSFSQGNFQESLVLYEKALSQFEKESLKTDTGTILSMIGLIHMLLGNIEKASQISTDVFQKYSVERNEYVLARNAITLMKLASCSGFEENAREQERSILEWSQRNDEHGPVYRLYQWVKNIDCPKKQR